MNERDSKWAAWAREVCAASQDDDGARRSLMPVGEVATWMFEKDA